MPVIEITSFALSEAFLADPNILTPALDFLVKVNGCLGIYHGIPEEDEQMIFLFIVWETFEHHKALIDHPNYPNIIGFRPSIGAGGVTIKHVEFIQDPFPALSAPTTEILEMTLKAGKTKEDLYDVLKILASKMDVEAPYPPVSRGEVREEPGKSYFLVLGWNSSKEHLNLVGQPSYKPAIQQLFDVVEPKMFHAALKKHSA